MNNLTNSATAPKASTPLPSIKVLLVLLACSLFTLLVSCNPSNIAVSDYYNIDGTFLLKFTVTESTNKDQVVGSIIESERTFESNGNSVNTVAENANNRASGTRLANVINFSRVTSTNVKIDTTITMTSDDNLTGTATSSYEDDSKVVYTFTGVRKK